MPFDHGLVLDAPTEDYVRSPGLHVSEIYGSLYKELEPKRFDKGGGPDITRMLLGTIVENTLATVMSRHLITGERPGEFAALASGKIVPVGTPKSIIFSPDHFFYNGITRLGEFKVTWMTLAKGIREAKFDKWWCQMMAYGYLLKMPNQILYAYFVNGHGKWSEYDVPGLGMTPSGPLLRAWKLAWTERQLKDNWTMLMRHAVKKGMAI